MNCIHLINYIVFIICMMPLTGCTVETTTTMATPTTTCHHNTTTKPGGLVKKTTKSKTPKQIMSMLDILYKNLTAMVKEDNKRMTASSDHSLEHIIQKNRDSNDENPVLTEYLKQENLFGETKIADNLQQNDRIEKLELDNSTMIKIPNFFCSWRCKSDEQCVHHDGSCKCVLWSLLFGVKEEETSNVVSDRFCNWECKFEETCQKKDDDLYICVSLSENNSLEESMEDDFSPENMGEYEDILPNEEIDSMNQSEQILDYQNSFEQMDQTLKDNNVNTPDPFNPISGLNYQFDKNPPIFDERFNPSIQKNKLPKKWSNSYTNLNWNGPHRQPPHQQKSYSNDYSMDYNQNVMNDEENYKNTLQNIPKLYETSWSNNDWLTPINDLDGEKSDDVISGEVDEDSCEENISQEDLNRIERKNIDSQITKWNLVKTPNTINRVPENKVPTWGNKKAYQNTWNTNSGANWQHRRKRQIIQDESQDKDVSKNIDAEKDTEKIDKIVKENDETSGESIWLEWSHWSRCIKGAGHGVKFRKRKCVVKDGCGGIYKISSYCKL